MAHVLYNHMTHTWDDPYAEDGWSEHGGRHEDPVQFSRLTHIVVSRIALAAATAVGALMVWGLVAGALLGIAE